MQTSSARYVVPPAEQVALRVDGESGLFPVRRVYCVGRNYAAHAAEMGDDGREPPFFFQKNPQDLDMSGRFPRPEGVGAVHHEVELAVMLGAGGTDVDPADAPALVFGYAVALDMTKRDLQAEQKKQGRPWEIAKAFARSAPIGLIRRAEAVERLETRDITLDIGTSRVQSGKIGDMIWSVPEIVAHLSRHFILAPGDVVLTGTPAGVGPVERGDQLVARVGGLPDLEVAVV